ncbi:hypothetical protein [Pseudomonas fluorescens]|uniref:hypothetical protein n=1 Tax=Pseudomonas fluorescens TaxID=294 RepID=UPI002859146A|nr:hypothetical protein [Pseudomonas fluorescens]MDR6163530.1 hypothetical protein [Pseudomonas fluorescens]
MSRVKFDTSSIPDWATLTDWARLEILQNTVSELYEDRDTQRLRADTAEADLAIWKTKACEAAERHVAAEQRIADLTSILASAVEWFDDGVGRSDAEFDILQEMRAALNQKSEGESQ